MPTGSIILTFNYVNDDLVKHASVSVKAQDCKQVYYLEGFGGEECVPETLQTGGEEHTAAASEFIKDFGLKDGDYEIITKDGNLNVILVRDFIK